MNLQNLNVTELSAQEAILIDGGGKGKLIRKALKWLGAAIGVYDAIDDFKEGWNSVECEC